MSDDGVIGRGIDRVDGFLKVTGRAPFSAEFTPPGTAYGVIVPSTIPHGRIVRLDTGPAERAPGVLAVMTHRNAPKLPQGGKAGVDPPAGRVLSLLQEDAVQYNGEPIAVVIAGTFEQATHAATLVRATYARDAAHLSFDRAKHEARPPKEDGVVPSTTHWGEDKSASVEPAVRVDAVYTTSMEHHNPMEPHATVAHWEGDDLVLHDATQYVSGVRETMAKTLGIPPDRVRVLCPFVGGGFGCKGSAWSHVALAAMSARLVQRPVKVVLARPQMFGPVGGRPQTEQHVLLAAQGDGRLLSIRHDVISHTSAMEDYVEPSTSPTRSLYASPYGTASQRVAVLDVGVPTFQRAPGESTGNFAIESAMDELAHALKMDPLALRLVNYADSEPHSGKPWSSKKLRECYAQAAERFGWSRRTPEPRSMRDGGWLVGWGMATATYPGHRMAAAALARLQPDGTVLVQSGSQDLGTGTYTIMTQVAAQTLGLRIEHVRFELGDTAMPRAPVSGGSMTAASVGPAVEAACKALREAIAQQAVRDAQSPLHGLAATDLELRDGTLRSRTDTARRESVAAFAARRGTPLEAHGDAKPEKEAPHAARSFGAVFVEVRVDPALGVVRVPRIVATYSVGRVLNAKTALSQLQGGIVWGIGEALLEKSLLDERYGRFANGNLAEYHVPVNADVQAIDVTFVDENDTLFNPLGARGIGEIGITGVAGGIANAVYHATGKRVRDLPITLDKLI